LASSLLQGKEAHHLERSQVGYWHAGTWIELDTQIASHYVALIQCGADVNSSFHTLSAADFGDSSFVLISFVFVELVMLCKAKVG